MARPKTQSSLAEQEMDKVAAQFETFDQQVKDLTLDRMNMAPKQEVEPQTKLSQSQIEKSRDIYLKPDKTIGSREKFNEKFRDDYNFTKEYVKFIAENKEIIGEAIEIWTKPFPGMPAEFWKVPTNKPLWGPRYLAEQIKKASYHRLTMQEHITTGVDGQTGGRFYGQMAADSIIQRLDALPVSDRKSVFMGASGF